MQHFTTKSYGFASDYQPLPTGKQISVTLVLIHEMQSADINNKMDLL